MLERCEDADEEDFASRPETRWCPGCGDYAVLAAVQQLMPELGSATSRGLRVRHRLRRPFSYSWTTLRMHAIHGRAPALATGLAASPRRPLDLIVTGDGDARRSAATT